MAALGVGEEMSWDGERRRVGAGGPRLQKQQQLPQENKQREGKKTHPGERKERGAKEAQRHPRSSN